MYHPPTLLPELSHFIEDRNALVVSYQKSDKAKSNKSPSATYSSAAMHHWGLSLADAMQESVNENVKSLSSFLTGGVTIRPIGQLVVIDDPNLVSLGVLQLNAL